MSLVVQLVQRQQHTRAARAPKSANAVSAALNARLPRLAGQVVFGGAVLGRVGMAGVYIRY